MYCSVDLRCRGVGESSTYAKPQKIRLKGIQNCIASSVQENFFWFFLSLHRCRKTFFRFFSIVSSVKENFFSVFSIASSAQENFFSVFSIASSVQENFFGFFYRFIGAGKLFIGFFYRFIGEKNVAQENCIALFDFFLKNCASVSL
jgi:hypothetical protein